MKKMYTRSFWLSLASVVPIIVTLPLLNACTRGSDQKTQAGHGFFAVLVDTVAKKPVQSARIILALKKEGKLECTIDTSLTGVSNDSGEVRIPSAKPGEYVIFYSLTTFIRPGLHGKIVNYDPKSVPNLGLSMRNPNNIEAIRKSLGQLWIPAGASISMYNDNGTIMRILNGYIYSTDFDLAMISAEGLLRTVRVPNSGGTPVQIEINTTPGSK